MDTPSNNLRAIRAADIDPRFDWKRHLPALGTMAVDFEERVNYKRLHEYRIGRARSALETSELGALLVFDVNNIRYLTSTKIGEWERDKLSSWALLVRGEDPILWDFGSAAAHHKFYCPWLKPENKRAGLIGLRGMVHPDFGLMERHAKEIFGLLKEAGVERLPVGVDILEPPLMFQLQKLGLKVVDGQQTMLEAREIKNIDEIALLNRAAAMVDGAYQVINDMPRPGGRAKRNGKDERILFDLGAHHLLFEGDAVVLRGELDHAIVVGLKNTVAVANAQLRLHHRAFADLGTDVTHLDDVRRRFLATARAGRHKRQPKREHDSERGGVNANEDRICPNTREQHRQGSLSGNGIERGS